MAEFVQDCQRCGAKSITFDVLGDSPINNAVYYWSFEVMGRCRACKNCSIALFSLPGTSSAEYNSGGITSYTGAITFLEFVRFISVADRASRPVPQHLPIAVENCFREGAASFGIGAYNAAAAMFRLTLDIASKGLLPAETADDGGPNSTQRKRLFDRLAYLMDRRIIAPELRDLADCVREDGNDGAHDGTLTKADAEDLIDFAEQLLERVYSEPARLKIAKARREARRSEER